MDWKLQLKEIFDLATLHSWCTQVDQLIAAFNSKNYSAKLINAYLVKILQDKNLPGEHYIISLVFLSYYEYPFSDIIELSINSLYGKLNKNDILFFKEHLFEGNFPLSADLSYNLTNRSFLSPKAAIKKAMEIDSVLSKTDPGKTVLYINFILSRIDMNEENRAMAAFLLLRLDVELPAGLKERVFKYLDKYKSIIKELLEEENGINIDNFNNMERVIKKVKILNEEPEQTKKNRSSISSKKDLAENKIININGGGFKEKSETILEKNLTLKNNEKQRIDILTKSKKKAESKKNNPEFTPDAEPVATGLEKVQSKKNKPNKKNNNLSGKDKKIAGQKLSKTVRGKSKHEIRNVGLTETIEDISSNSDISNITEQWDVIAKKENNSWKIRLKNNKQILENLLSGLRIISSKHLFKGNNKKEHADKLIKGRIVNISNNKVKILFIGLIVLLVIISFSILANLKKTKITTVSSESIINMERILPLEGKSLKDSNESEGALADDLVVNPYQGKIPEDFPIKIIVEKNTIKWEVAEGDSITDLYFALQDYKAELENTKLEKISKLNWKGFFENFKTNNSVRQSYHLIYPGEVFTLNLDISNE